MLDLNEENTLTLEPQDGIYKEISIPLIDPLTFNDPLHVAWAADPAYLPPAVAYTDAVQGLVLPGVAGNYAYLPDAPAYDITGDITLVARVALDDWTPAVAATVIGKWTATGNQRSYNLTVSTGGLLQLAVSTDGSAITTISSTAATSFANGETAWVAAAIDVDDGGGNRVTKFWVSADGVTWAQLGSTVTTAGTVAIFASSAVCEFGSITTGVAQNLDGALSVARIYSGSGFTTAGPTGTLVVDVDFRRAKTQTFQAVGDYGIKFGQGLALGASGLLDGATIPTSAALELTGDIDIIADVRLDDWTPSAIQTIVAKRATGATAAFRGWQFQVNTTGALGFGVGKADDTIPTWSSTVAPTVADGDWLRVRVTRNATTGEVLFYTAPVGTTNWTQLGAPVASDVGALNAATSAGISFGYYGSTSATNPLAGTISRVIVKDGIDGESVIDAYFAVQADETESFYDYCGNLVTVNVASQEVTVVSAAAASQQLQQGSVLTYGARLDPVEGLMLPGLAGNYAAVPDSGIYDIVGDLTLIGYISGIPTAEVGLVGKWTLSGNQRSYLLTVQASGVPRLYISADGINASTRSATAAITGACYLAATLDVDDGAGNHVTKFWTSVDGITWTQLGTTVTMAGTVSIFAGTAVVEVGSWATGTVGVSANRQHVARIYSGAGFSAAGPDAASACVLDLDFRREATQGFQGTSDYGIKADGLVLSGIAGTYATTADNTVLDILGDLTLVAKVTLTTWNTAAIQTVIGKWTGAQASYLLRVFSGQVMFSWSPDGTTVLGAVSTAPVAFTNGTAGWIAATIDVDNGAAGRDVKFWTSTDGATWTQLGATVTSAGVTSIFAGTSNLEFGVYGNGTTSPMIGTIHRAQIFNGAGFSASGPADTNGLILDADFESQAAETLMFDASARKIIPGEGIDCQGAWRVCVVTPTTAPGQLNLTTDLETIECIRLDDWTPAALFYSMGHWGTSGTYHFTPYIGTGGLVGFTWSTDGTTSTSLSTTVGIQTVATPGDFCWIRRRLDVNDGAGNKVLTVHYSLDPVDTDPSAVTWTLLETVTSAGTTSLFTGSSTNMCVGALNAGSNSSPATIAYADFAGSFDGPRLFKMDLRNRNAVERSFNATSDYGVKQGEGLVLPPIQYPGTGVAGPWAIVPDSAALSITGDITLVAKATVTDWTITGIYQALISKRRDAAQRSYMLRVTNTGTLELYWSPDGAAFTTVQSTVPVPFADGATGWLAATLDVDNGAAGNDVKFWTSSDGITWSQLGSTVTTAGVASLFDSTAPVDLGSALAGTAQNLNGTLHVARIYSGSGFSAAGPSGTLALDVDFTEPADDTTSFVCDTGQVVTVWGAQPEVIVQGNRLPVIVRGCYPQVQIVSTDGDKVDVDRGLISNGSGTGNVSLVSPVVDVTSGLDIRWKMDCPIPIRQDGHIVGQYTGTASTTRFLMFLSAAGNWQLFISTGSSIASTTFVIEPELVTQHDWFRVTWRNLDGRAVLGVSNDGVTWSEISRAIVAAAATMPTVTSTPFHISANQAGSGGYLIGDLHWLQIRDGVDGNIKFDADFRRSHTNAFVADTGQRIEVVSSLNPYNLTAAQQANYEAAVDIFNDAPAWHYDGTDDRHTILTGLYAAQPVWVVMIGSWDTLPAATRLAMGLDSNSATRGLGQRSSGATHLDMGGTVTGGAYTIDQSFIAVGYADGASGEVWLNGVLVASGATGAQAVNQLILGCGRIAASTYQNFLDGYITFSAIFTSNPAQHSRWGDFKAWARQSYGISIQ